MSKNMSVWYPTILKQTMSVGFILECFLQAKLALDQFHTTDRANRKQYFHLHRLEPRKPGITLYFSQINTWKKQNYFKIFLKKCFLALKCTRVSLLQNFRWRMQRLSTNRSKYSVNVWKHQSITVFAGNRPLQNRYPAHIVIEILFQAWSGYFIALGKAQFSSIWMYIFLNLIHNYSYR